MRIYTRNVESRNVAKQKAMNLVRGTDLESDFFPTLSFSTGLSETSRYFGKS